MRMPRLVRWLTKTKSFLSTPPGEAEVIWDVRVFGRASHFVRAVPERSPQRRGSSTCRAEHHRRRSGARGERPEPRARLLRQLGRCAAPSTIRASGLVRSEEHTSELQSLMRITYAVFCLKKNKQ